MCMVDNVWWHRVSGGRGFSLVGNGVVSGLDRAAISTFFPVRERYYWDHVGSTQNISPHRFGTDTKILQHISACTVPLPYYGTRTSVQCTLPDRRKLQERFCLGNLTVRPVPISRRTDTQYRTRREREYQMMCSCMYIKISHPRIQKNLSSQPQPPNINPTTTKSPPFSLLAVFVVLVVLVLVVVVIVMIVAIAVFVVVWSIYRLVLSMQQNKRETPNNTNGITTEIIKHTSPVLTYLIFLTVPNRPFLLYSLLLLSFLNRFLFPVLVLMRVPSYFFVLRRFAFACFLSWVLSFPLWKNFFPFVVAFFFFFGIWGFLKKWPHFAHSHTVRVFPKNLWGKQMRMCWQYLVQ